jgi:hypothetical protein
MVIRRHFNLSWLFDYMVLVRHHIEDLPALMVLGLERRSALDRTSDSNSMRIACFDLDYRLGLG